MEELLRVERPPQEQRQIAVRRLDNMRNPVDRLPPVKRIVVRQPVLHAVRARHARLERLRHAREQRGVHDRLRRALGARRDGRGGRVGVLLQRVRRRRAGGERRRGGRVGRAHGGHAHRAVPAPCARAAGPRAAGGCARFQRSGAMQMPRGVGGRRGGGAGEGGVVRGKRQPEAVLSPRIPVVVEARRARRRAGDGRADGQAVRGVWVALCVLRGRGDVWRLRLRCNGVRTRN
ncbi:hypothetical protein B0H14DRAFT_2998846, partial [Mycena olivaceomarginata]